MTSFSDRWWIHSQLIRDLLWQISLGDRISESLVSKRLTGVTPKQVRPSP
ncbi:MAG: hypothetical protein ACRCZS_13540 [Chroococcidiopsis sp.]